MYKLYALSVNSPAEFFYISLFYLFKNWHPYSQGNAKDLGSLN